jgi:hypothetical protein
MYEDYFAEGEYDEEPEEDWESDDPCHNCGPWCHEWGGDGLCMVVIREQARQRADYNRRLIRLLLKEEKGADS